MPNDVLLSFQTNILTFEGDNMLKLQIRGLQRARVVGALKVLDAIIKNDGKPAAKNSKLVKVKVFDPAVTTAAATTIADQAANVRARLAALLEKV